MLFEMSLRRTHGKRPFPRGQGPSRPPNTQSAGLGLQHNPNTLSAVWQPKLKSGLATF